MSDGNAVGAAPKGKGIAMKHTAIVASAVLGVLALAAPVRAQDVVKHSGSIVAIADDARTFVLADIVGTGLWSVTFSVLGYLFWQSLDRALELARTGKLGLFGLLALAALGIAAYRLLGTKSRRRRTIEWLRRRQRGVEGPEPARGDSER